MKQFIKICVYAAAIGAVILDTAMVGMFMIYYSGAIS